MFHGTVLVRQVPDVISETSGLAKYNRSRMPRCVDILSPAIHKDGRFITGLDEDALDIKTMSDTVERQIRYEKTKELREQLEKETGLDLKGLSDYWKTYSVSISADEPLTLNKANPHDVIKYFVLTSNSYVIPHKDEMGNPRYAGAKYYIHVSEIENKEKVSERKIKDQARSELLKLADNKDQLLLIGQFLEGPKYNKVLDADTLYSMLSDYLELNKDGAINKFLKVVKIPKSDLLFKITVDTALRTKIIKFKDKYYQRGQVTLGKTVDEVYKNLGTPQFAAEYQSIKEELESK